MYRVSVYVVKPPKPEESKRIVIETIKKEYVDTTKSGDPKFYIRALSRYLQRHGYDINPWAVFQIIYGAKVDDSHVFEKVGKVKSVYRCDPDLFNIYLAREFPNVFTIR